MSPSSGAFPVIVSFPTRRSSDLRLARVHVTLALVPLHVQPAPLALWKVTPAGSVSVTVTLRSVEHPALLPSRVYVSVPPARTKSDESLLVIERSVEALTVVGSAA